MHIEIQVALNFVISYLYNKLPRRRVNLFGEELERALREKFNGHWYPDKPVRGSAYRCIKTGTGPVDPVLERAARESGIPVQDILENMPQELAVWVDPAEVSYRIGEKGAVRILYSEANGNLGGGGAIGGGNNNSTTPTQISSEDDLDTEVRKTFNPDAQCFRPIQNALGNLNLGPSTNKSNGCISPYQSSSVLSAGSPPPTVTTLSVASQQAPVSSQKSLPPTATVAPSVQNTVSAPGSVSPIPQTSTTSATAAPFLARPTAPPLTFTTATFAQTKFGSTKLKTSSKRANRMSPTEFSNYIKQRALQQQQQQQQQQAQQNGFVGSRPRSLSPHPPAQPNQNGIPPQAGNPENYFFPGRHYLHFPAPQYHHQPHPLHSEMHFAQQQQQHKFPAYLDSQSHFYPSSLNNAGNSSGGNNSTILPAAMSPTSSTAPATSPGTTGSPAGTASSSQDGKQQLLDGLNFGLQTYQSGQYQHLLVAN